MGDNRDLGLGFDFRRAGCGTGGCEFLVFEGIGRKGWGAARGAAKGTNGNAQTERKAESNA